MAQTPSNSATQAQTGQHRLTGRLAGKSVLSLFFPVFLPRPQPHPDVFFKCPSGNDFITTSLPAVKKEPTHELNNRF